MHLWCAIVLLLVPGPLPAVSPGPPRKRPDPGTISVQRAHVLNTAGVRLGEACVYFHGGISDVPVSNWPGVWAGDFFDGLKRTDTVYGPVFHKGSKTVTEYPDQLYLRADSVVVRCSGDMKYTAPWPVAIPEFVKSLRAEAGNVRDLRLHTLPISLVFEREELLPLGIPTESYCWLMTTKGVRLTDTLVVDLYSKDGSKVGRFIVDLGGRTRLW